MIPNPKDSIINAIQVNDDTLQKQIAKKYLYYSNIIIWTVIFFYPLLGILDYIYAYEHYQTLLFIKVITVVLIYAVYDICLRLSASPLIPLHVTFFTISLNAAILCNIVSFEVAPIFFLLFASLFMLFNLAVFWPPSYSFGHFFTTLLMIIIGFHTLNTGSLVIFITQGAGLFIITGFFSCFIPVARHSIIKRNTLSDIRVKNSTAQLHVLHQELFKKNLEVEESNSRLTELVAQQDTFLSLVKQDIGLFIAEINETSQSIRQDDENLKSIVNIQHSVAGLSQLVELLPEEDEAPSSDIVLQLSDVNISDSFGEVIRCITPQMVQYNLIAAQVVATESFTLQLDQLYLDQLFFNLLANSLKFSISGTRLIVKIKGNSHQPVMVMAFVSPDEDIRTYLNEYWMPENITPQSIQKGLGPGFYIARLLARKMDSEIIYHATDRYTAYELHFHNQTPQNTSLSF